MVDDVIFAGKNLTKSSLKIVLETTATNSARHIFNKIGGLNIFQNDDAGLQLNIGGRSESRKVLLILILDKITMTSHQICLVIQKSYYTPPS